MPTFPLHQIPYLRPYQQRAQAAQDALTTTITPLVTAHTAADSLTLRGIPAVGRGVAGHIAHTQPEALICR